MLVYEIVCNNSGERYIGSTTRSLESRMSDHVRRSECWARDQRGAKPSAACDIIVRGDYVATALETVVGEDTRDLIRRERYYCYNMDCINRYLPGSRVLLRQLKPRRGEPLFMAAESEVESG